MPAVYLLLALVSLVWLASHATSAAGALAPANTPTPTLAPGTGDIAGSSWHDLNANGIWDSGEPVLGGMQIALRQSGQTLLSVVTDAEGAYRFSALSSGIYQLAATAPAGYRLTSESLQTVFVSAGAVLTLNFGAVFVPTPTPTPTRVPMLDIDNAAFAYCGGIVQGDTRAGHNNVSRYACQSAWAEDGPELVYRIELGRAQTFSALLLTTTVDLDLFLLPSAYPETCLAAGDNYLTYNVQPGVYYLVVDGYQGAAGAYQIRLDCPLGVQATPTPTRTPSPTFTPSPTLPPTQTPTPSPTATPRLSFLPLLQHTSIEPTPEPVTVTLQQGINGYDGAADTWLSAWPNEDTTPFGSDTVLRLRYNRQTVITTHKAPLVRFDLAALPSQTHVVNAQLKLYLVEAPSEDVRAAMHGLLRAWDETTATWMQPAAGQSWAVQGAQGAGADYMTTATDVQQILQGARWYTFDVTALAQIWISEPTQNNGAIVLARAGDSDSNMQAGFSSREYGQQALRPQLVITYWVR